MSFIDPLHAVMDSSSREAAESQQESDKVWSSGLAREGNTREVEVLVRGGDGQALEERH